MNIKDALSKLDATNDEHWTADGLPRLDVVGGLAGGQVKRQDVTNARPGFTRESAAESNDTQPTVETAVEPVGEAPLSELELLEKKAEELAKELVHAQRETERWRSEAAKLSNEAFVVDTQISRLRARQPNHDTKNVRDYIKAQNETRAAKAEAVRKFFEENGTTPAALAGATNAKSPLDAAMNARKSKRGRPSFPRSA